MANLLAGQASAEAVTALVRQKHADVLFVQELTGQAAVRLERVGLGGLLPHRVAQPVPRHVRQPLRPLPDARRPADLAGTCHPVLGPA